MELVAPWSMTEEGEWILAEPYASEVARIRAAVTEDFNTRLCEEVARISPYGYDELMKEYVRRVCTIDDAPIDKFTSFIVDAMSGQLYR